MAAPYRACLLIPVYGHQASLPKTLERLQPTGLDALVIDDGSGPEAALAMDALAAASGARVRVRHRERNGGKGLALKEGFAWAAELGFSHAFQVDADGQHELERAGAFLALSRAEPLAAVCAAPVYDLSAPKARLLGRKLTDFWVAVNTLSRAIPDAMCGMRLYPLGSSLPAAKASRSERMAFDTEVLVRLSWAGVPLRFLPAKVTYPVDGKSTFKLWRDNAQISSMHARLFFGMLLRLPFLLARRVRGGA